MMTDSTELFVFSATFDSRPPDPFTQPKMLGSSADAVSFALFSFSLSFSLTNSNSEDSREAVGWAFDVILAKYDTSPLYENMRASSGTAATISTI